MPSSPIASTTSGCTCAAGRLPAERAVVPSCGALEQRLGHLRPAGVLDADEEDAAHVAASCPEMNPYVTTASTAPKAGAAR